MKKINAEILILLSGGIDSTACIKFYKDIERPSCALHIDYGQPASKREAKSAIAIAKYYSIPLFCTRWEGPINKTSGFILGRNSFLLTAALLECPDSVSVIALGIHSGTFYMDCTKNFIEKMQSVFDIYENSRFKLSAPFIEFNKQELYNYCIKNKVPIELTYSCENGTFPPCGNCQSCKDRELLNDTV